MQTPSRELLGIAYGYVAGQALYVAAELGIADLLRDESRTIEQLAETTNTDVEASTASFGFLRAEASSANRRNSATVSSMIPAALVGSTVPEPTNLVVLSPEILEPPDHAARTA